MNWDVLCDALLTATLIVLVLTVGILWIAVMFHFFGILTVAIIGGFLCLTGILYFIEVTT